MSHISRFVLFRRAIFILSSAQESDDASKSNHASQTLNLGIFLNLLFLQPSKLQMKSYLLFRTRALQKVFSWQRSMRYAVLSEAHAIIPKICLLFLRVIEHSNLKLMSLILLITLLLEYLKYFAFLFRFCVLHQS